METERQTGERESPGEMFDDLPKVSSTNVLDPEDSLMEKFQRTLRSHLGRVEARLSEEIFQLEASIKRANKELEAEDTRLYQAQERVLDQRSGLERCQEALAKTLELEESKNRKVEQAKEIHRSSRCKLTEEKDKRDRLFGESKKLLALETCFRDWESDLNNYLILSRRVSKKDSSTKRTALEQKQRRDYILYKLSEEVWRLESEIASLEEQVRLKDAEKKGIGQAIADVNTDLEIAYEKHKSLRNAWNSVVANISKKDAVYQRFQADRLDLRNCYEQLLLEAEKLRKETDREMETNEHLTSLRSRVEANIGTTERAIAAENQKISGMEFELLKLSKLQERLQQDHMTLSAKWQSDSNTDAQVTRELEITSNRKNGLEEEIFARLEEKVVQDKAARHVNELLKRSRGITQEYQFLVAKTENVYGGSLLRLERAENERTTRRTELEDVSRRNVAKEKEIENLKNQTRGTLLKEERKRTKLVGLNKTIDEIQKSIGESDQSPQEAMIQRLDKGIEETQRNLAEAKQYWMRHQGSLLSLSQQRDSQLRELNLLQKEIMITDQKNLKIEHALENLRMVELEEGKTLERLQQRIQRMNADLIERKDTKEELEERNRITKNEFLAKLQDRELDFLKLQTVLRSFMEEKTALYEELNAAQREALSWEKKVKIAQDTIKKLKEERSAGETATMRAEIHRMEMRLSQLKRIQEKLVDDMEYCVLRREAITEKAVGRLNRNPKERHDRRIIARKRLADQKIKIKQIGQATLKMEKAAGSVETRIQELRSKLNGGETALRSIQDGIRNLETNISELETRKCYNIQRLVFKQRKGKLLRDVKSGRYKAAAAFRTESILEEELGARRTCQQHLRYAIEKTERDFPFLKDSIHRIFVTVRSLR